MSSDRTKLALSILGVLIDAPAPMGFQLIASRIGASRGHKVYPSQVNSLLGSLADGGFVVKNSRGAWVFAGKQADDIRQRVSDVVVEQGKVGSREFLGFAGAVDSAIMPSDRTKLALSILDVLIDARAPMGFQIIASRIGASCGHKVYPSQVNSLLGSLADGGFVVKVSRGAWVIAGKQTDDIRQRVADFVVDQSKVGSREFLGFAGAVDSAVSHHGKGPKNRIRAKRGERLSLDRAVAEAIENRCGRRVVKKDGEENNPSFDNVTRALDE